MAKKKKKPPSGPSNAYLLSFGDTMTALLAFFIVINSLAKEQTGANLYAGTGSFVNQSRSAGLPGSFRGKSSENAFQMEEPGPLYIVDDEQESERGSGDGPDDENNNLRVVDREKEQLQRFLIEMDQLSSIESLPQNKATVVFDFFEPLNFGKQQFINAQTLDLFRQSAMRLYQGNYEIDIIVWARMPSPFAWNKSIDEANQLRELLIERLGIASQFQPKILATGKPWFYSDERRPRFSFIVKKR